MTNQQRSLQKPAKREEGPVASRPHIPGYGIPRHNKGLLRWSDVSERIDNARHYWICTVSAEGRPHATPVDGLWLDERLYFSGGVETRRNRNLMANPAVCVHLESGTEVVILHGEAQAVRAPDHALMVRLADASASKYGYASTPEDYGAGRVYVFRPRVAFAWKQFLKDATRWRFHTD